MPQAARGNTSAGQGRRQQLRLMGPLQVRHDGAITVIPHSAGRLLAAIALIGPISRTRAASVLWPDTETARAAANLRSALSRLTDTVVTFIDVSGDVMAMNENVEVDVQEVHNWINAIIYAEPHKTPVAAPPAVIGNELLAGWDEAWLAEPRERLKLLQTHALETAAERLIAAGKTAEALPYALSAVQAQPWSESANRLIIEIHARRGDPSNALRRFHRFKDSLEKELGVQPGPDMLAAIRQLYPFGTIPPVPE